MSNIRPAVPADLARIAEIEVFNYRMNFYPIFRSDAFYFDEMTVPNLMPLRADFIPDILVYDDGVVKAFLPEGHGGAHGRDEVLPIDKMLTCSKIYVAALAALDDVVE